MTPRTKIIIAGVVVTALIGLIVIDLATSPKRAPTTDESSTRTTATTRVQTPTPPPPPPQPQPLAVRQVPIIPRPAGTTPNVPSTPVRPPQELDHEGLARILTPATERVQEPTPLPSDEVPPPPQPKEYTVASGDSFWTIAGKIYGDASLFHVIQAANPKVGEFGLQPGMKLQIPSKPVSRTVRRERANRPADPNTEVYVIKRGDVLWNIAKPYARARGKEIGAMVAAIQEANPGLDPERLKVDAEIVIPK
jgi:nucleoid-associated protein YgaU